MLQVKCFNSISLIESELWDSILSKNEIFNTHDFIDGVEKAKVENATFWYLLFYDGEVLAGHAVLSSFTISLDLFISANRFVHVIKKIRSGFFKVRVLICGLPASFGQSNVKIVSRKYDEQISRLLVLQMERLAAEEKINLLCVKEFKEAESDRFRTLLSSNFFKAYSLPYMRMEVCWNSFSEYLESLRHPYRRVILKSLKKSGHKLPFIYPAHKAPKDSQFPVLVLSNLTLTSAQNLYDMYLAVMERTPTKLETLNLEFFQQLQLKYAAKMELLTVQHKDEILSAGFLMQHNDELTFMLVGRKNAKDEADSYFNLVYGIIELAIARKLRLINLGQTAYWVKQRIGGRSSDVHIYFKSKKPIINWLLKKLKRVIFPQLELKSLTVFTRSVLKKEHLGSATST
ncbi:MAG: GNAT family N-acetyltransferase [Cyclobacteriaceae bacterium]|nr:GNAT family N-acetyltransferase [Cyclobacteriaceae bacterium]